MSYSGIVVLALAIHQIVNHSVVRNTHFKKDTLPGKYYRGLVMSMLAFFAADFLWGLLYSARAWPFRYMPIPCCITH